MLVELLRQRSKPTLSVLPRVVVAVKLVRPICTVVSRKEQVACAQGTLESRLGARVFGSVIAIIDKARRAFTVACNDLAPALAHNRSQQALFVFAVTARSSANTQ